MHPESVTLPYLVYASIHVNNHEHLAIVLYPTFPKPIHHYDNDRPHANNNNIILTV